jgi:PAS domain S-box-containing protein
MAENRLHAFEGTVSLSTFVTRLVCLCMVPLLLLAGWLAFDGVRTRQTEDESQALNLAQNFVTYVDDHLSARIAALNMLAVSPLLDDATRRQELYQEALGFLQSFGSHVILADIGVPMRMLFNTRVPFGADLPLLPQPASHAAAPTALKTGKPSVGDTFLGPIAIEPLIAIAVPAMREGRPVALLLSLIETAHFQGHIREVVLPSGWSLSLRDGRGETIAHYNPEADQGTASRLVINSKISPWSAVLTIPRTAYWAKLIATVPALGSGILCAVLLTLLVGMKAGNRVGKEVASLTETGSTDTPPSKIREVAAARLLLNEAAKTREKAEAVLRESERNLRLFIEHAPVAIAMFDREMRYLAVSRRWITDYRLGHQDILNRSHYAIFPEISDAWKAVHQRGLNGEVIEADEDAFVRADGTVQWLHWVVRPWQADADTIDGIIILTEDITRRKEAEEALRASQQIVEGIVNAIPVRVFWKDKNLVYLGCNKEFAQDAGFSDPKDIIGKDDYLMGWRDRAELYRGDDRQVIEGGFPKSLIEELLTTSEGNTITILTSKIPLLSSSGEISGVLGTYMDITERKRAEIAVQESRDRYRALFENMLNGFAHCKMLFDDQGSPVDFFYLDVNQAFTRLTRLENVVGRRVSDVIPGIREMSPEVFKIYGRVALTGKPETFEIYFKPLGIWLSVVAYSLNKEEFIAVFDNITERKRDEESLRISHRFLELVHDQREMTPLLEAFMSEIKTYTGCEAVGIRVLDEEGGIPYWAYTGFSQEFFNLESPLSITSDQCMCINVIKGATDPSLPFYTQGGSFYMNGTTRFLATVSEEDKGKTRNRCNYEGYETVALVPFRDGDRILGLIHVADRRESMLPLETVELLEKAALQLGAAIKRVSAEQELRESRERYRLVADFTYDWEYWIDPVGKFLYVSPSCERVSGYLPSYFIGDPTRLLEIVHPDDRYILESHMETDLPTDKPPCNLEFRIIRGDGQTRWVSHSCWSVYSKGVYAGRRGSQRDITERKESEKALEEESTRRRILFEQSPDGIVIIHPQTAGFVDFNRTAHEMLGYSREEFAKLTIFDLEAVETVEETKARIAEVVQEGRVDFETLHRTKQGDTRNVHVTAQLTDVMGASVYHCIWRDITDRKHAEAEIRDSEERNRKLVEASADAILVRSEQIINYANPAAVKLFRAESEKDLIGKSYLDLIHPDDRSLSAERVRRNIEEGWIAPPREHRILALDGQVVEVESTGVPVRYKGGYQTFGVFRDITERKKAYEEKAKLESQLQQAQKMESLGTLAGGIAHDFNNILGVIIGCSEMLEISNAVEVSSQGTLKSILTASTRAKELVRQILAFSRHAKQEKILLNLKPVIRETFDFLRASIPAAIRLRQQIDPTVDTVIADPTQMQQILMNLCTNAVHAMEKTGGVLDVGLSNVTLASDDVKSFPDLDAGEYVRLSVTDTGHGIAPGDMQKIFDPYFTTKELGKGTGLGLSVVHGIVKAHGGTIKVYSELGKGASFQVFLPRAEGITTTSEPRIPQPLPGGHERILLVDDEAALADIEKRMLTWLGYEVEVRTSAIEALAAFKANPRKFDLVLTDLSMPQMTGMKLAKEMVQIRSDIPIVLCTGYSDQVEERTAASVGIKSFLFKPLVANELAEAIRKALGK